MSEEKNSEYPGLSDSMWMKPITMEQNGSARRRKAGKLFANSCRTIEIVVLVLTCIYLAIQTNTMVAQSQWAASQTATMAEQSKIMSQQYQTMIEQTKQNSLTNKLTAATFLREHYQTINKVLAEQPEARKALKLDIKKVLAYMLITDYDNIHQMYKGDVIDKSKWRMLEPFIRQTMIEQSNIRYLWYKPGNRGRSAGFKDYVDACVYYNAPNVRAIRDAGIIGRLPQDERIRIQNADCPDLLRE